MPLSGHAAMRLSDFAFSAMSGRVSPIEIRTECAVKISHLIDETQIPKETPEW